MTIALGVANVGQKTDASVTSTNLVTSSVVASGSMIVIGVSAGIFNFPTCRVTTVTGGSLTWTVNPQSVSLARTLGAVVSALAPSGLASSTTITINFSTNCDGVCSVASSYTGNWDSTYIEAVNNKDVGTGTAWSSNALAPAAGALIATVATLWSAPATSTPTSPTVEDQDFNGNGIAVTLGRRIETVGGSYTNAGTWTVSDQVATASAAFRELIQAPIGWTVG